jgi:hypothetical protein
VHNGNDEVNESEPIIEEPKKEVKFNGCHSIVFFANSKKSFSSHFRTKFPIRLLKIQHSLRKLSPNKQLDDNNLMDLNEKKKKGI